MTPIYLVLTALFGVSVYLYLTRQLLAIAIAAIFISFLSMVRNRVKNLGCVFDTIDIWNVQVLGCLIQ